MPLKERRTRPHKDKRQAPGFHARKTQLLRPD